MDLAAGDGDGHQAGAAIVTVHTEDGVDGGVDRIDGIGLPSIQSDLLIEIAAVIVETHADQRRTEVRGFFTMIAREDAESARVDGE